MGTHVIDKGIHVNVMGTHDNESGTHANDMGTHVTDLSSHRHGNQHKLCDGKTDQRSRLKIRVGPKVTPNLDCVSEWVPKLFPSLKFN
jgi:hypothetical protein